MGQKRGGTGRSRPARFVERAPAGTTGRCYVTGERAAPPPCHVLHPGTGPRIIVDPEPVERPALPGEHRAMLLVRRIEDRLQKAP